MLKLNCLLGFRNNRGCVLSIIDLFSVCTAEIAFVDAKRPLVSLRGGFPARVGAGGQAGAPPVAAQPFPRRHLGSGERKRRKETQQIRSTASQPLPGGFSPAPAPAAWAASPPRFSPETAAGPPRAQVIVVFSFQPLLYTCIIEYGGGLF